MFDEQLELNFTSNDINCFKDVMEYSLKIAKTKTNNLFNIFALFVLKQVNIFISTKVYLFMKSRPIYEKMN